MNSTAKTLHRATDISAGRILLVDDEPSICWALSEALRDEGFEVETAGSVELAAQVLARSQPDTIVLDVRLPGWTLNSDGPLENGWSVSSHHHHDSFWQSVDRCSGH